MFSHTAFLIIAFARGCSLCCSRAVARVRSSVSVTPVAGYTPTTVGLPSVRVPVLSKATIFTLPACSTEVAVLKSMPFRAPLPIPTIMATGVASPRAQGQEMTRTDIACMIASPTGAFKESHTMRVTRDMPKTTGTNTPDTLSASFAMGAFVALASLTIRMICERVVSSPTRSALHFR